MRLKNVAFLMMIALVPASGFAAQPDHSTCASAISFDAPDHMAGVKAEYTYLAKYYPEYDKVSQALIQCEAGPADEFVLADASGAQIKVVFDLSKYWGKGF